jgi:hypothetical protein
MRDFFLKIEQKIPLILQMALLVFFGVVYFINQIEGIERLLLLLGRSFMILLGLFAVILLITSKKTLIAYITLYFLYFSERFFTLFRSLLSYNFKFELFGTKPDLMMIIYAMIELYLIIMIIAHLFKEKLILSYESHQSWLIFFGFIAYYLVFYSFGSLIPIGLIILLLMLSKEYLIALLVMISCFIFTPFMTFDRIILDNFTGYNIIFYLRQLFEISIVIFLSFYVIRYCKLNHKNMDQ